MKIRNKILDLLQEKFGWSLSTSQIWLSAPNIHFDGKSPEEMINTGNSDQVLYLIGLSKKVLTKVQKHAIIE